MGRMKVKEDGEVVGHWFLFRLEFYSHQNCAYQLTSYKLLTSITVLLIYIIYLSINLSTYLYLLIYYFIYPLYLFVYK
jgi:hypothetical protein